MSTRGVVRAQGYGVFVAADVSARVRRYISAVGIKAAMARLRASEQTLEALRDGGRIRPHVLERVLAAIADEEEKLARAAS